MTTYKSSDAPSSYGSALPSGTLTDLLGLIEHVEGFGETTPQGAGKVYDDGNHNPSVGYGFNLKDENTLKAVLDGLSGSVTVNINGQPVTETGNVFQVASAIAQQENQALPPTQQVAVPQVQQIVDYFSWLVNQYPTNVTNINDLQTDLNNALQDFLIGAGSSVRSYCTHCTVS